MRPIRILMASPGLADSTSFYRAAGPLYTLERQYPGEIEITTGGTNANEYEWPALRRADILFFQRPSIPAHVKIIESAIAHGLPVWIDYDDDLLSVPRENPCHAQYSNPHAQQSILACLKLATFVSVSTQKLKDKYQVFNKSIEVIPNALDDTLFSNRDVPHPETRQKVVFWRGSNTHMGDLIAYQSEILEVYEKNPGWQWFFLGYDPWFLTEKMKPGTFGVAPWASHIEYFRLIQQVQPQVLMVPLKFDEFNEAKSHIAWLEGTLAGSAVLGPEFDEWKRKGCNTYENPAQFKSYLQMLLDTPELRSGCREASRQEIDEHYLLTHVNQQRYNAAKHLAETGLAALKPI